MRDRSGYGRCDLRTDLFKADERLVALARHSPRSLAGAGAEDLDGKGNPDDVSTMATTLRDLRNGLGPSWVDFRIVRADGVQRCLEAAATISQDADDEQHNIAYCRLRPTRSCSCSSLQTISA